MKVLVDTCVWSDALRKKSSLQDSFNQELVYLIQESRLGMIGAIRQEILSGIKHKDQFKTLKNKLASFSDISLEPSDYELAAEYFNLLRSQGIQGSNTDFLISAVAANRSIPIFTKDRDFEYFAKHLPISFHTCRE